MEGPVALLLRYRDGSGHVAANLIEVDIPTGNETTLLVPPGSTEFSFDSQKFSRSNAAQVHQSDASAQLDFENHAYYVELTLAATSHVGIPIFFPPKVSVIQLIRQFE